MPPQQNNQPFQPYNVPAGASPQKSVQKKSKSLVLLIALILSVILLLGSVGFGVWAYGSQQDYKNNSDKKSEAAVAIAVEKESTRKDNEFTEKEKNPLKTYKGPAAYGSLEIQYPKTWSAYVVETDKGAKPIDGFFHPSFVPNTQGETAFALRIEVTNQSYDQEMKQFDSKVKAGKVSVSPYEAANVPGTPGAKVTGEITTGQQNVMVLLPIRDKTIKIYTESQQFAGDFNNIILANLKFVP